ncbi:polymorphic toxin-type HINT domain-containing protein [Acaryochloris sp. IP29b_bin.148]|uniref:polymorphic toxin-type HINT domain-containing protein n=1 Tax=Acaryochloris sp. IP29b_bin.148 TaxID=2969218 RepID=UPI0026132B3A|nr:polymorphic toxin-type HINT domain-containing protein [Acaryochloris sp. IP29b_bin.148]
MNDRELETFFKSPSSNTFDSSLAGSFQEHNQSIFGESLSSEPQGMPSLEDVFQSIVQERSQDAEGSDLEDDANSEQASTTGFLAPTNFSADQVVAHLPGLGAALESGSWLLDQGTHAVEQAVESGSLFAKDQLEALSDTVQSTINDAWENWNDPNNSLHNTLDRKLAETVEDAHELANEVGRSEYWARFKQRYNQAIDSMSAFTEKVSEALGYGATTSDIAKEEAALEAATSRLADNLMDLTEDPDFEATIKTAFGDQVDVTEVEELIEGLAEGEAGPEIEVIDGEKLAGLGAFGDGRIFISDETLAEGADNPEVLDRVLLEEVGHYLDQELNDVDSPGDEGAIFAGLAQGENFSDNELQDLKNEDDSSALIIDGKTIVVENSKSSDEERDREIERLKAEAEQLATVSPYASQAINGEAKDLRKIAKLEETSEQLATASPYASQAINEEAKDLRKETHFYSNADQSDVLLSYSSSGSMLTGERVEQWQQDLKDLGYDIEVDGYFGPQTDEITRQFQEDHNLTKIDGIVGPETLAALEAASTSTGTEAAAEQESSETAQIEEQLRNEIESLSEQIDGLGTSSSSVTQALLDELTPLEEELDKIELEETIESLGTSSPSVTQALQNELNATETELAEGEANDDVYIGEAPYSLPLSVEQLIDRYDEIEERVQNWPGTDNDPIFDRLVRDLHTTRDEIVFRSPDRQDAERVLEKYDELNQKVQNWQGTDNDPTLDRLVRDLHATRDELLGDLTGDSSSAGGDEESSGATTQVTDEKPVHLMSIKERGIEILEQIGGDIGPEFKEQLRELFDPTTIAFILLEGAVAATPIGWFIKGKEFAEASKRLYDFAFLVKNADSEEDLSQASEIIAEAVVDGAIGLVLGIDLTKKGGASGSNKPDDASNSNSDADNGKNQHSCFTSSFIAGTEVLTPEGEKNIEDLQIGDWVIADNPTTPGEVEPRQVLNTFSREVDTIIELNVDGEIISTTTEHPFWVEGEGWVEAENLEVGMMLQTDEETFVEIDRVSQRDGDFDVFNFEVHDFHTYFVSDQEILVHNCGNEEFPNAVNDPYAVVNALSDFESKNFFINGQQLLLEKSRMKEILERHHPSYYDGSESEVQSFFPKKTSIDEITNSITEVLKQNPERVADIGANGVGQMKGIVNGVEYTLGLYKGHIGQFYPS